MNDTYSAKYQEFKLTCWMLQIPLLHSHNFASWSYVDKHYSLWSIQYFISFLGFPELPLYQTAHTYFNVTKSPLVPGFIKGSVAKVSLCPNPIWKHVIAPDNHWMGPSLALGWQKVHTWPGQPHCKKIQLYLVVQVCSESYVWRKSQIYECFQGVLTPNLLKPGTCPISRWKSWTQTRTGSWRNTRSTCTAKPNVFPDLGIPNWLIPSLVALEVDPDLWRSSLYKKLVLNCFISKVTGSRLTLNTSSFVTYAQIYELSLIVSKDTRKGMVKMDIDLGVLPVPLLEIDCAAPGLCFPTFGGIFVNPTSRYFQNQKP